MKNYFDLTKELVICKSVSGNKKELDKCHQVTKKYLGPKYFYQEVISNGFKSLIISPKKLKKFDVLLYGHLDVVPAEDKLFQPKVKGDKIYGRGTGDMKGQLAALVDVFKNIKFNKLNIGLVLVPDEELGGFNGLSVVLKKGYKANLVLVPDGGFGKGIVTFEKGIDIYKLTATGKGAHGARPWLAENPAVKLIKIYNEMIEKFKVNNKTKNKGMTCNLGVFRAGERMNQVPQEAEMQLDCRFPNEELRMKFKEYIQMKGKREKFKVENPISAVTYLVDSRNKFLKVFKKIAESKLKKKIPYIWKPAGSDARFLSEYNIPSVTFQAEAGDYHSQDEWISVSSMKKLREVVVEYLQYLDNNYEKLFKKDSKK